MDRLERVQQFLEEQSPPPMAGEETADRVKYRQRIIDDMRRAGVDPTKPNAKSEYLAKKTMMLSPLSSGENVAVGVGEAGIQKLPKNLRGKANLAMIIPFIADAIVQSAVDDNLGREIERIQDDSEIASGLTKYRSAERQRDREVLRNPMAGSFDPVANTRDEMIELQSQIDRRNKKPFFTFKPESLEVPLKIGKLTEQYTEQQMDLFDTHPHKASELANQFNIHAANQHPTVQHAHIHGQESVKSRTLEAIRRYTQEGEGSITRSIKDAIARVARKETGWSAQDPEPSTASPEQLSNLRKTIDARRTQRAANQMFTSLGGTPAKEPEPVDPEKEAARQRIREILKTRGSSINI